MTHRGSKLEKVGSWKREISRKISDAEGETLDEEGEPVGHLMKAGLGLNDEKITWWTSSVLDGKEGDP